MNGGGSERGRHRIRNRLQAPSCQHRARHAAWTHGPWDHDLSRSQPLNRLSHPGAPTLTFNVSSELAKTILLLGSLRWLFLCLEHHSLSSLWAGLLFTSHVTQSHLWRGPYREKPSSPSHSLTVLLSFNFFFLTFVTIRNCPTRPCVHDTFPTLM